MGKDIAEKIRELRKRHGITLEEIATAVGVGKSTVLKWETGKIANMRRDKIADLAKVLHTTPEYLMGWEDIGIQLDELNLIRFPIIGNISAGYNGLAVTEETGDFAYFSADELRDSKTEYFCLRVKGDSMYPRFLDGDIVLVHKQTSVDSGDIAVVMYNGDEATVKKVNYVKGEDWLELLPINPEYKPQRITGADLVLCRVLGKVIKLQRDV